MLLDPSQKDPAGHGKQSFSEAPLSTLRYVPGSHPMGDGVPRKKGSINTVNIFLRIKN